jgi:porin
MRPVRHWILATTILCAASGMAWAEDAPADQSIWERANLLGDMGGLRGKLADHGVTLTLAEQDEVLGNTMGGLKQGSTFDGLTTLTALIDAEKAFGWTGGTINISALNIHGHALSPSYLGNLQTASGIAATPTTRLWEVWVQQSFADGAFDVKLGQQSLDQEFMASTNGAIFLNTMMGWPMVPSADLYAGGPAYPLSSLGVRLRAQPREDVTLLAGVFDDNPPGGPFDNDSQLRGTSRFGANFNLRTGALFIAEAQYAINQKTPGDSKLPEGLPTAAKIGFYADSGNFYDQQIAANGQLLASNPSLSPRQITGNSAIYALLDQGVWKAAPDSPRLLSVFARVLSAPANQNLIDFSANGGVTLTAPLPGRDDDTFGLGFGYAHVSSRARAYDQNVAALGNGLYPVRSSEIFIEATYQAQVTPWLQVQPDVQYVARPGGGAVDPSTGKRIRDELVLGVRTNITF